MTESTHQIDAVVFADMTDSHRVRIRDSSGRNHFLDRETQGVDIDSLREGEVLRCNLSDETLRVLDAERASVQETRQIEAIVYALIPEFQLAQLRDREGHTYCITPNTPGVELADLRLGQAVRCTVTTRLVRVVSADLGAGSNYPESPVTGADVLARLPFRHGTAPGELKLASLPNPGIPQFLRASLGHEASPRDLEAGDFVLRLASVTGLATHVLGSEAGAERWLNQPAMELEQRRPVDLVRTFEGTDAVTVLLMGMPSADRLPDG